MEQKDLLALIKNEIDRTEKLIEVNFKNNIEIEERAEELHKESIAQLNEELSTATAPEIKDTIQRKITREKIRRKAEIIRYSTHMMTIIPECRVRGYENIASLLEIEIDPDPFVGDRAPDF